MIHELIEKHFPRTNRDDSAFAELQRRKERARPTSIKNVISWSNDPPCFWIFVSLYVKSSYIFTGVNKKFGCFRAFYGA